MSEQLTPEDIEDLRNWLLETARARGAVIRRDILLRAAAQFLQLRDIITSFRSLQAEDVTDEQVEAVQTQAPEGLPEIGRSTIASVMRGMLASLDEHEKGAMA